MIPVITWKEKIVYGVRQDGYIGKWHIFSVFYNSIDRSKPKYVLSNKLPGLEGRVFFETQEDAKENAKKLLECWFTKAFAE